MESIEVYKPAGTVEQDFVNLVKLELNDIRNTFFKIGFRLNEARNNAYYRKLGYNTIEECAEALFGFKRTTTYDLMTIASRFADSSAPMILAEKYRKFNQSQLVLFTNVRFNSREFIRMVSSDDTIEKLRKAKRYWEKCSRGAYGYKNVIGYMSCESIDEFIEFIEARTDEGKPKDNDKLSEKDFNFLDKIINSKSVQISGQPDEEKSPDIRTEQSDVIEISKGDYEDKTVIESNTDVGLPDEQLDPVELLKIKEDLKKFLSDKIDFMEYKIAWGEDKTKPGIRVVSSAFVDFISSQFYAYLDKNRTEVKNMIQAAVSNKVRSFDYHITLCGRKQPINAFCGNVSNWILDTLLADYLTKQKEMKNNKRGKK